MFTLRFSEDDIGLWAAKNTSQDDLVFLNQIGPSVQKRGYMIRSEFLEMCEWKSPRTKSLCAKNSDDYIKEITQISFASHYEPLRIQVLTLLVGVSWATASVILHFCCVNQYPILDFRALWSLNATKPTSYSFPFWWSYTEQCRGLASRNNISMRILDRALWQYSKENQTT